MPPLLSEPLARLLALARSGFTNNHGTGLGSARRRFVAGATSPRSFQLHQKLNFLLQVYQE
jgi:hypothetical protein